MTDLPPELLDYFAKREVQRAAAVDVTLASLTERERRLIREAAVMGYVRGRMHPKDQAHPKDSAVLAEVIDACLAAPDLYPIITGVRPCGECAHPKYNHRDGEDPVTPGVCLQCEAQNADEAHHDYRLAADAEEPQP